LLRAIACNGCPIRSASQTRSSWLLLLSGLGQDELHPVLSPNLEEACHIGRTRRRGQLPRPRWHGFTSLRDEVDVKRAGGIHDQQSPRLRPSVPERVDLTGWNSNNIPTLCGARLRPDTKRERALENVERFIIRGVTVRWRSGAGCDERLHEALSSARVTDEEAQQDASKIVGIGLCVGHGSLFLCGLALDRASLCAGLGMGG
jgi:hypothetical protein